MANLSAININSCFFIPKIIYTVCNGDELELLLLLRHANFY